MNFRGLHNASLHRLLCCFAVLGVCLILSYPLMADVDGITISSEELTFDPNGGVGGPGTVGCGVRSDSGVPMFFSFRIPDEIPSRDGYTFMGWTDKGGSYLFQPGEYASGTFPSDSTLYAVWLANLVFLSDPVNDSTITYVA